MLKGEMSLSPDRRNSIGGSDVAAILGLSKWKTPVDVWLEKRSEDPIPEVDKIALRFGQFAEEFVAQEYSRKVGLKVQKHNRLLVHPEYPFLTGNVDRLVIPAGQKIAAFREEIRTDRLLECKTSSAHMAGEWGESGTDEIPLYYLTQVHWYMMLTGCRWADVAVLIGNNDFRVYHIPTDFGLQEMMLKKTVEFWEQYVIGGGIPPAVTAEDINRLYPVAKRQEIEANEILISQFDELLISKSAIKTREKNKESLEMKIKEFMGEKDTLTHNGQVIATWRADKNSRRTLRIYERMVG